MWKSKDLRRLCQNIEQFYLCAIWQDINHQTIVKNFIATFCQLFDTQNINNYLTISEKDQFKCIEKTLTTLGIEQSNASLTYYMILPHVHHLVAYHSMRDFKKKKKKTVSTYISTINDITNPPHSVPAVILD